MLFSRHPVPLEGQRLSPLDALGWIQCQVCLRMTAYWCLGMSASDFTLHAAPKLLQGPS